MNRYLAVLAWYDNGNLLSDLRSIQAKDGASAERIVRLSAFVEAPPQILLCKAFLQNTVLRGGA